MTHRTKYSWDEKMKVLYDYDHGKQTKKIAEQYHIPISTVLYFIRNRNRFENGDPDEQIHESSPTSMANINPVATKKIRFTLDSFEQQMELPPSSNQRTSNVPIRRRRRHKPKSRHSNDDTNEQQSYMNRIRKIPYDMKLKIIQAWENRDRSGGGVGWSMKKIAESFGVSTRSVSRCIADRAHLKSLMNQPNNMPLTTQQTQANDNTNLQENNKKPTEEQSIQMNMDNGEGKDHQLYETSSSQAENNSYPSPLLNDNENDHQIDSSQSIISDLNGNNNINYEPEPETGDKIPILNDNDDDDDEAHVVEEEVDGEDEDEEEEDYQNDNLDKNEEPEKDKKENENVNLDAGNDENVHQSNHRKISSKVPQPQQSSRRQQTSSDYHQQNNHQQHNHNNHKHFTTVTSSSSLSSTEAILDQELVDSINDVFDKLARIKMIAQQRRGDGTMPARLSLIATQFTDALLATANRFVERFSSNNHHFLNETTLKSGHLNNSSNQSKSFHSISSSGHHQPMNGGETWTNISPSQHNNHQTKRAKH